MNILGYNISISRAGTPREALTSAGGGGWHSIREPYTGAWQQNVGLDFNIALSFSTVFACVTLIASDVAKLRVKLVEQDAPTGIWSETTSPAFSPVLRKPNNFQTRVQFWESWMLSKLIRGNTYALKIRDARNIVTDLYVLNPLRVVPLIATPSGDVYYQLAYDPLLGISQPLLVPASEIIHDRFNVVSHNELLGVSPIMAAAQTVGQGIAIQTNSTTFFNNQSMPGGILTAPGAIADETARRLKEAFEMNFGPKSGNSGRLAVVGDGLKYEKLAMSAEDAQVIDQLKWTAQNVCQVFHVPGWKVGVDPMPALGNIQAANVAYYTQALQVLIEAAECLLDEGLEMPSGYGSEFDTDNLLRMDSTQQITVLKEGVSAGIYAPNEARAKLDQPPAAGGETPYLQQQNYSLAALAKRDASADPFGTAAPKPAPAPAPTPAPEPAKAAEALDDRFAKALFHRKAA